jgi:phage tail tape-measure protein
LNRTSGVASSRANNINGNLARDAIANDYQKQGLVVRTEAPTQGGARRVDIQVEQPAADPRYNKTVEIESKLGRAGLDRETRAQVANDARALAENGEVRGAGHALESAGRVLRPVAVAADAVQLGLAFHQDGNKIGRNTGRTAAGIAGGWGGALVGAESGGVAGAAIGSVVPVVGTAVGGAVGAIVGGIAGGVGGDWAGRRLFDEVRSIF